MTPSVLILDEIVQAAESLTGLTEIGEPDLLEAMDVLVAALNRDANLRPDGVDAQRAAMIGTVATRLVINDLFAHHPEILDEEIRGPIVIVGLPRTGTTKLHRMLARHPDLQSLPLWRVMSPAQLGPAPSDDEDPRIALAERASEHIRDHFPDFFAAHPMLSREPEEEVWMQNLVLRGLLPCYTANIPSYRAWAETRDVRPWYEYLRKLLQLFQWEDGTQSKTWLLKAPEHLGHLDLLLETFPNATIVHTHRDPVVAIASLAALCVASRRMYTDSPNPHGAGQFVLEHRSGQLQAYVEQRRERDDRRFVDVSYREIVDDTVGVIERICDVAELDLRDDSRAIMHAWEADNPPGKHGRHRYTLEDFGLTVDQVSVAFSDYHESFGKFLS